MCLWPKYCGLRALGPPDKPIIEACLYLQVAEEGQKVYFSNYILTNKINLFVSLIGHKFAGYLIWEATRLTQCKSMFKTANASLYGKSTTESH